LALYRHFFFPIRLKLVTLWRYPLWGLTVMKDYILFPALAVLIACGGPAFAQETVSPPASLAASPAKVVPHKALYKVSLAKVKHSSSLHDVSGTMVFDLADACDGWTVHQHMKMQFAHDEGDIEEVTSSIVTWEAKDEKSFVFNVRRVTGAKEDESYKGRATMGEHGGVAKYSFPADKEDVALASDGTLFPIAHTMMILDKARAGEKLFSRQVFDGSDLEGSAEVSTFIRPRVAQIPDATLTDELRKNPLVAGQGAWPVRLAFYPPKGQASEPDYEMEMDLQDNGIARSMVIDYGEFSVAGTLTKLELADPIACGEAKAAP